MPLKVKKKLLRCFFVYLFFFKKITEPHFAYTLFGVAADRTQLPGTWRLEDNLGIREDGYK